MAKYDYEEFYSKPTPHGVDPRNCSGWTEKEADNEIASLTKYYGIGKPGSKRIGIEKVSDREGRGGFSIRVIGVYRIRDEER